MVGFVKQCTICMNSDKSVITSKVNFCHSQFPKQPWEKLALDLLGPYDNFSQHKMYAFVLIISPSVLKSSGHFNLPLSFSISKNALQGLPCSVVTNNSMVYLLEIKYIFQVQEHFS